jgi:xanthine dehydrogenase iron-sulfur cluster and FAD-binding subunit A
LIIYAAALPVALAQSADSPDANDSAMGSERARLANQRIQAEVEMRAREEQRRLEEEAQARLRAEEAAARSEMAAAQSSRPETAGMSEVAAVEHAEPEAIEAAGSNDMDRTLEQLRLLGELKDDGYISEKEFQRIKQKILDDRF